MNNSTLTVTVLAGHSHATRKGARGSWGNWNQTTIHQNATEKIEHNTGLTIYWGKPPAVWVTVLSGVSPAGGGCRPWCFNRVAGQAEALNVRCLAGMHGSGKARTCVTTCCCTWEALTSSTFSSGASPMLS
jgi:hypothetical protein